MLYTMMLTYLTTTILWVLYQLKKEARTSSVDMVYFYVRQLNQRWGKHTDMIFPLPFIYYRRYLKNYMQKLRDEGVANEYDKKMLLLDEKKDNQYLGKAQKFEEDIKSVDYDVWINETGKEVKLHGLILSGKYSQCPKCNTYAFCEQSRRTIESPTYSSAGKGLLTQVCKFCKHSEMHEYHIAKLQRSSSSSSGSSSHHSSSSSGSSYGGGSSGGGGAGSSW